MYIQVILFVVETFIVIKKVGQGVLFLPIPTMHVYIVFIFSIVFLISTKIFTLKLHSTWFKNCKSSCYVYTDTIVYNSTC